MAIAFSRTEKLKSFLEATVVVRGDRLEITRSKELNRDAEFAI